MLKKFLLLFLGVVMFGNLTIAQNQSQLKKLFNNANDFFNKGSYQEAYKLFGQYESLKNDNYNVKFKIGYCLLELGANFDEAILKLKDASENTTLIYKDLYNEYKSPVKSLYFYASVLHANQKYNEAIAVYNQYYSQSNEKDTLLKNNALMQIRKCEFAINAESNKAQVRISNLKEPINSEYSEHTPILSEDLLQLYFTSQRKGSTGDLKTNNGYYFEDVYTASNTSDKSLDWSNVKRLSPIINSPRHESALCISNSTKELFLFIEGDIYVSKFENDDWSIPQLLKGDVNSKYNETHAYVTNDGKLMYFVSNRPGGYGGKDIYLCQRQLDGSWSSSRNLGSNINTSFDEDAPFIFTATDNEIYMYFSSTGHLGMGGYDVFVSKLGLENDWSLPVNLGCPINSPSDEISFVMLKGAKNSYFTSNRIGGLGDFDIYRVDYTFDYNEYYSDENNKNYSSFKVVGKIYNANLQPSQAKIAVFSKDNKFQRVVQTDGDGNYNLNLPKGNVYEVSVFGNNIATTSFDVNENETNLDKKDIVLGFEYNSNVVANNTTTPVVKNTITNEGVLNFKGKGLKFEQKIIVPSLFELSKVNFKNELTEDLDVVVDFIKKHPEYVLIINGHTDNTGNEYLNYQLSVKRAKNVYEYFIKSGVDADKIKFNAWGSELPAYTNKTRVGRMSNRRVDILLEKK